MPYLSVFGSNLKKPLPYLKSATSNLLCCKVSCKKQKQILHLRPKISWGWNLIILLSYLKSAPSNLSK